MREKLPITAEEEKLPIGKYYHMEFSPVPADKVAVLAGGPCDPKQALPIQDRSRLFEPGHPPGGGGQRAAHPVLDGLADHRRQTGEDHPGRGGDAGAGALRYPGAQHPGIQPFGPHPAAHLRGGKGPVLRSGKGGINSLTDSDP